MRSPFRLSAAKIGGLYFLHVGRLNFVFSVSRRHQMRRATPITIELEPVRSTRMPTTIEHQPDRAVITLTSMPVMAAAARPPLAGTLGIMAAAVLATLPAAAFLVLALFGADPSPVAANVFATPQSACELAALAPTDMNVELCLGGPFLD